MGSARNVRKFFTLAGVLSGGIAAYVTVLLSAVAVLGTGLGLVVAYAPLVVLALAAAVRRHQLRP